MPFSPVAPAEASLAALARDAYVYGLPLYEMVRLREQALARSQGLLRNRFYHLRELATDASRSVTAPNNDTLYSVSWLDLAAEPMVLALPELAGRYVVMPLMDMVTNVFAMVGRRSTGNAAGAWAIADPGWRGNLPDGMSLIRSPSRWVWLIGRTLVQGPEDLAAVHALQDRYRLVPLSAWPGEAPAPRSTVTASLAVVPDNPWNFLQVVSSAMRDNPPPDADAPMLQRLQPLFPIDGIDASRYAPAEREAIGSGIDQGRREVKAAAEAGSGLIDGWRYPSSKLGNFGTDYFLRAVTALVGIGALPPEEAMYVSGIADQSGAPLHGRTRYMLRFPPGRLPPVDAFWSLSLYQIETDGRLFFTANPLGRYAFGDRTAGLQRSGDGGLEVAIQHEAPAETANWLPAPVGSFRLILRAYQPRAELLAGRYRLPPIERL